MSQFKTIYPSSPVSSQWDGWISCMSAGVFFFYIFFQMNLFDAINQPLRDAFQIDPERLSWMSSCFVWASILFFLPAGVIIDRFSIKKIICTAMLLCILATAGFGWTHSYILACVFRACVGLANACCFPSCMVLISRYFPPNKQAFITGIMVTMASLGGMTAHTPFAYLNERLGWRQAIYVDAIIGVFILIWLMIAIKDTPKVGHAESTLKSFVKNLFLQILFNKQNLLASMYTACLNLLIMVLCALWGMDYLKHVHHLSDLQASHVISGIYIGNMCGNPLFGALSDKVKRRKIVMFLGASVSLALLIPLLVNTHLPFYLLWVLFFFIGLFNTTQALSYSLIAESNPAQVTGLAMSVASIIITGWGGVGQILYGTLLQYHAQTSAQFGAADFQYAFYILPIGTFIACLCVLGLRETYCKKLDR